MLHAFQSVAVHVTGTNNGTVGLRSWLVDGSHHAVQRRRHDTSAGVFPPAVFTLDYTLMATSSAGLLFFKGPGVGTNIDNVTFSSRAITSSWRTSVKLSARRPIVMTADGSIAGLWRRLSLDRIQLASSENSLPFPAASAARPCKNGSSPTLCAPRPSFSPSAFRRFSSQPKAALRAARAQAPQAPEADPASGEPCRRRVAWRART